MARSSGTGKRAARRAAAKAKKTARPSIALRQESKSGYDFGVAGLTLSIANDAFSRQLGRAKVWGCAYGFIQGSVSSHSPPVLSLISEHPEHLRAAMETMREWCVIGGPGAVTVEIAFTDVGYLITISQDSRALAWRTIGFGNVARPTSFSLVWTKQMDSRHPMLEDLADYASATFAPFLLHASVGSMSVPQASRPIKNLAPILLERLRIYRDESEIPGYSPLATIMKRRNGSLPDKESRDGQTAHEMTPTGVLKARDDALLAILPKTLLVLRHRPDGQQLVTKIMEKGFARWQVEQALANLRLSEIASSFPPEEQAIALQTLRLSYAEYGNKAYTPNDIDISIVIDQINFDLEFILTTISNNRVPKGLDARMNRLRELGFE